MRWELVEKPDAGLQGLRESGLGLLCPPTVPEMIALWFVLCANQNQLV